VIVAMALPLAGSVLLGVSASRLGRWLPPGTAVRLLTVAMLVTALATGFVLSVAGVLVLAQIPLVAALGHYSARVLGSGLPVPVVAGGVAAVTVCGLLAAAAAPFAWSHHFVWFGPLVVLLARKAAAGERGAAAGLAPLLAVTFAWITRRPGPGVGPIPSTGLISLLPDAYLVATVAVVVATWWSVARTEEAGSAHR
jgi:hypothetical protein